MSSTDLSPLGERLSGVLSTIKGNNALDPWPEVEQLSQTLANGLRVRGSEVDNHTLLGKTELPQTLTTLISMALEGASIPADEHAGTIFELLRVAANLCLDHDDNRGYLLDAGLPQVILSLLEGYADGVPPPPTTAPLDLSISHLKVVRTAIGVLLNASIGYDAVKFRLISLEAALTILKLSSAIYPPMSWLEFVSQDDDTKVSWYLRSAISNWAWRTVSELKDTKDDSKDDSRQILSPDILPWITPTLSQFIPPYTHEPRANAALTFDNSFYMTLIHADFEVLEETCTLLESLSLDVEDIRLALARGYCFPAEHSGVPCLKTMLDFIDHGAYPPSWNHPSIPREDKERMEKTFNICKAALIKSVVEVAGEEKNEDVLWDDSIDGKPGGEFVYTMVKWIKDYVVETEKAPADLHRDDLVICASLSLGNLSRREKTSTALISPPLALAPILSSSHFLSPRTDVKLKHGILGLLKHIAQSSSLSPIIPASFAEASIVQRINESGIWDEGPDNMAVIVQLNAIGVVKHLCNASVEHSLAAVVPPADKGPAYKTALQRIMALVSRSDSVPIQSEGTRVLVNITRTLLLKRSGSVSSEGSAESKTAVGATEQAEMKQVAVSTLLAPIYATTLSWFLARSGKFPILINEGVVALNLLSGRKEGGSVVLDAILTPVPESNLESTPLSPSDSEASSPTLVNNPAKNRPTSARHALEMLTNALRNTDNPAVYPVEIRVNICTFLVQISRHTSGPKLGQVQEAIRPVLETIRDSGNEKEELLTASANKVLDFWQR